MIKGVGMKGHSMGGVNKILLGELFREGGSCDRFNNGWRAMVRVSIFPSNWTNQASNLENPYWTWSSRWSNWALFYLISACRSWVRVLVMWKVGVSRMGSGSTETKWIGDIYHCDHGAKGNPRG
jgi:hypothetical protein